MKKSKLVSYAITNIALYAFISLDPYPRWLIPNEIFYFYFIISTLFYNHFLNLNSKITERQKINIRILLVIFITYFTAPVIHTFRFGHFLWPIPFLLITQYDDYYLSNGYKILKKIIVYVSAFAILLFFLNNLNVPIPHYKFHPEFRPNAADLYRIYGPSISLYRGSTPIGAYYGLERITGIFKEPGHYGIYLGLLLTIEQFSLKTRENKIILFAGLLTFSTAFYGILSLGFVKNFIQNKNISTTYAFPIILALIFLIVSLFDSRTGDAIESLTIGRITEKMASTESNIIDSRVGQSFKNEFAYFIRSPEVFTGKGYHSLEEGFSSQNYRALIYRFGVLGFLIVLFLGYLITTRLNKLNALMLFSVFIIILLHRSSFFLTPGIFFLMYIGTSYQIIYLKPDKPLS